MTLLPQVLWQATEIEKGTKKPAAAKRPRVVYEPALLGTLALGLHPCRALSSSVQGQHEHFRLRRQGKSPGWVAPPGLTWDTLADYRRRGSQGEKTVAMAAFLGGCHGIKGNLWPVG